MNTLDDIVKAVRDFNAAVEQRVEEARHDPATGEAVLRRWREIRENVPRAETPTGLSLPRLALPVVVELGL